MRVFISSTVYDLIDIRAEVASLLTSLNVTPVMSDVSTSGFDVLPDRNSIETCLINVSTSDEVIIILNQRYGSRLGSAGFDNLSATHLEYKRAVKEKKPVHLFIRDRLQADYDFWKFNKRNNDLEFSWVKGDVLGMFALIDEHSKLSARSKQSNWYSVFNNSVDLKESISNYLQPKLLPQRLTELINENRFPIIDIKLEAIQINDSGDFKLNIDFTNNGGATAFNFRIDSKIIINSITDSVNISVLPSQSIRKTLLVPLSMDKIENIIFVNYDSYLQISVLDCFKIYINKTNIFSTEVEYGCTLNSRKYKRCPKLSLEIED